MPTYKTPDVYVEEISVFPPSVAEVETAIPAFIGYTEKATQIATNDLLLKPTKIYSLKEYEQFYGYPKDDRIDITVINDPVSGLIVSSFTEPVLKYLMYFSLKMFFDNGGGQCYIISVGTYQATPVIDLRGDSTTFGLQDGLEVLALEDEPTLIVIPEAIALSPTDYQTLVQAVLLQCNKLGDRFAIFDIFDGAINLNPTQLNTNRGYFGNSYLKYGASYYPFLKTTLNYHVNDTGIAAVNVTAGGSGYTSAPTVTLSGGGGNSATATATVAAGAVTAITITTSGTGYMTAPTVTLSGGGGTGATATAIVGETNVMVIPPAATGATAIANLSRGVGSISLTAGGNGYTSAPTVALTGGGGTGATATATLAARAVGSINLTAAGSGYTSAPTVALNGGGGTGATATATLAPGTVETINVTAGGSGYTSVPTVALTGGGGTGATATATLTAGAVSAISVTAGGSGYTSAPTVTLSGGGGTGATATATLAARVIGNVNITAGGTGYTSAPTVAFSGGGGTGATATTTLAAGTVSAINVTAAGTGYTATPTVAISGGGGTGATATATLAATGTVTSVSVTAGGSGYTSAPTVAFSGGGGSGATATATVLGGAVTAINVTNGGANYAAAPTVTLAGGSSTSAANLASFRTTNTALYNFVKSALKDRFVILPPSSAVAGVYAATDSNRGVWKAPANVSLADVIEPVIKLDNTRQDDLNVDVNAGKSINAIRAFAGKGTLVWGARTLAGNDNEWRYVSVRRFFNMVEESVKKSTYWAVFEPNDANTWVKVRGMIENYLTQKWREGALAGATPKDAFFVKCGLGVTMTAQDILEGRMNVEIGMAVVRPAEFIILKFSHKLQTS